MDLQDQEKKLLAAWNEARRMNGDRRFRVKNQWWAGSVLQHEEVVVRVTSAGKDWWRRTAGTFLTSQAADPSVLWACSWCAALKPYVRYSGNAPDDLTIDGKRDDDENNVVGLRERQRHIERERVHLGR